jgi:pilus assembly protein CpaB
MVLATGKLSQSTNFGTLEGAAKEYNDVSLLLLPEEVEVLVLAKEIGSYKLTLRNDDDREVRRDGLSSNSKTLLEGERVRLLQSKRLMTIQTIRALPVKTETGTPVRDR